MAEQNLIEYVTSAGNRLSVDATEGVIKGAKVLGFHSANGREYSKAAVDQASTLYEGAKVNVDHSNGKPGDSRGYRDRIGVLRNVRTASDGLYADLHFNPKHALAEQLAWDASNAPENVGLSHNVSAAARRSDGRLIVEQISKVHSVDLVADPATTSSLFESRNTMENMTLAELKSQHGALWTEAKTAAAAELSESTEAKAAAEQLTVLEAENDKLKAAAALLKRRDVVDKAITEAKLPDALVTDLFVEQCAATTTDDALAALIEDRKSIVGDATPRPRVKSREQQNVTESYRAPAESNADWLATVTY